MKIVLSGEIHSGKSTIVQKVREDLKMVMITGIRTWPLYEKKKKTGIYLGSFSDEKILCAHVNFQKNNRFCDFGVDLEAFNDFGVSLLKKSHLAQLFIIEELGLMEAQAHKYVNQIIRVFHDCKNILAVIQKRALDFWLSKIGKEQINKLYVVDYSNRDYLP
ncbi:MAG: nucleoside-triphosphatase, partial [Candidatus Hodarchaeota archaeon]